MLRSWLAAATVLLLSALSAAAPAAPPRGQAAAARLSMPALSAARIAAHFQVQTNHSEDHHVTIAKGALLRDSFGRPLHEGAPTNTVSLGGGTYILQRQPIVKDPISNQLMYYLWGSAGSFHLGGKKAPVNYSGFVRAADISPADRARLHQGTVYRNALDARWLKLLRAHRSGTRTVTPVNIPGTHVGRSGTANHPLSDYGFAHGRLRDHVYAVVSVLGQVTNGGQVGDILPRGTKVEATTIRSSVPNTRGGGLVFRLCIVKLAHRNTSVAMWIAEPVLR